jgi:glycosyltransferase involved in cell wall biosynthesis
MRRLIFITQVVDPEHPALGATVTKIRSLAQRVDEVVVLALAVTPGSLPSNCRVRTFGGGSRLERGWRLEVALAAELRPRPVGVLAHMAPIYAVLAAPLCRPLRIPLLLWYTHWHKSRVLVTAERASNVVVSVDRRSFPYSSSKVVATGHGIDLDEFPCTEGPRAHGLQLLSLGRYSEAKGIDTIIRAVSVVRDARLAHYGPASTPEELRCRGNLDRLVERLGTRSRVALEGPVPHSKVPLLFSGADALVNNMRAGAADKVVYEAAASCLPVLASNPIFEDLLPAPLRFPRGDFEALADRLRDLRSLDRRAVGRQLREGVARGHSVGSWADRILQAME